MPEGAPVLRIAFLLADITNPDAENNVPNPRRDESVANELNKA
ncbi:hypothetical protein [Undibacterium sp. RuTC16W]